MTDRTNIPSVARVYYVEPGSEPLTAADYLRAQADFTQTWIDTDAARAMNPANVAVSKDLAAATIEVLAELDRYREALERIYQQGRGPHVALAREALDRG